MWDSQCGSLCGVSECRCLLGAWEQISVRGLCDRSLCGVSVRGFWVKSLCKGSLYERSLRAVTVWGL